MFNNLLFTSEYQKKILVFQNFNILVIKTALIFKVTAKSDFFFLYVRIVVFFNSKPGARY